MSNKVDMTGRRCGMLVVVGPAPSLNGQAQWQCRCDCGNEVIRQGYNLRNGYAWNCGCVKSEATRRRSTIHGAAKRKALTPEYRAWKRIIQRCELPSAPRFDRYGGRGIKVCQRWRESFEAFLADMGQRPSDVHSIDRINNDGDYEPGNCRWATRAEQARNTSATRMVMVGGVSMSLADAAEKAGLSLGTVHARLKRGWPPEHLFKPLGWRAQ